MLLLLALCLLSVVCDERAMPVWVEGAAEKGWVHQANWDAPLTPLPPQPHSPREDHNSKEPPRDVQRGPPIDEQGLEAWWRGVVVGDWGWCPDEAEAEGEILLTLMQGYNKQRLPTRTGIVAHVEMHINDISSLNSSILDRLSEMESEFTLDLMYSEMWRDERLEYTRLPQGRCIRNITLDLDYLTRLWSPNTCIVNSKATEIHSSPSPNVFLILYQDGNIWKNCRMMVKAPCDIDLRSFPFDTQTCTMVFESYSYNSQKVSLRWFEEAPITLIKSMELADFSLIDWKAERSVVEYPNGNWDQLKASFIFKRRYGFFILQAYVPTYMTIFVAWINFWMDPKELGTRATLTISAFLAITLQFGNILKNQSPVSYVKALDVWMLACIIFLFTALAELAAISYLMRGDRSDRGQDGGRPPIFARPISLNVGPSKAALVNAYAMDRMCLMAYPPLFLCFNVFYWLYYGPLVQ